MRLRGTLPVTLGLSVASALAAQSTPPRPPPPPARNASPVLATGGAFPTGAETPLGLQVRTLLSDPSVARAHWGIAVTTLEGTPVYGLDEGKLFRPASTAKLFTAAAAMALLGPDARFTTDVYGDLDPRTGAVKGNLVIVGGGDPSFGTPDLDAAGPRPPSVPPAPKNPKDLEDLANQLLARGLHTITGNIVADDALFDTEPPPEGWAAEDLVWGYGALPSALSFGDNQLRLTIKPRPANASTQEDPPPAALLQLDQVVPFLHLANNVATEPPETGTADHIEAHPVPGHPRELALLGNISPSSAPVEERVALPDPAQYTAEALRSILSQRSVRTGGKASVRHNISASPRPFLATLRSPEDCETSVVHGADCSVECSSFPHPEHLLAQHTSPPLAADVGYTLKTSANLHAEVLLRQLEAKVTCAGATTLGGARLLRGWLLQAGLPDQDFVFYDGSGLSTKDLVTPRAEAQLLAYASTQPWYAQWRAGLPIAGVDGTLAARFTNSPLKGKVFAKTGTLGESRALAGYLQCDSGRELIFAILEDNHDPGGSADRTAMDKLVEAIAAAN